MRWLILFFLFICVYFFRLSTFKSLPIPDGSQIRLLAHVSSQPYLSGSKQIIRLGQFLVFTQPFPEYFYGQKLEIIGKVQKRVINRFQTDFVLNYPTIRIIEEEKNLNIQTKTVAALLSFRRRLENIFGNFLPEPQASLLSGVVLGTRRQMPKDFRQNLQKTGTIHVVVASGYNISVIAGLLISVTLRFIKRQFALFLSFFGILAYTLMAGGEPPVVRAAIMGSLTFLAQFLGREKDAWRGLFFAGGVMLLANPLLLFDLGFQLSFLATAGILAFGGQKERLVGEVAKFSIASGAVQFIASKSKNSPCGKFLFSRIFSLPFIGGDLQTTLAAQAGVLPILLSNFGQISAISPLINALVLPVIPLIMILGLITAIFGLLWQPAALIASWFAWVPLTYFIKVVEWFGNLPWASFELGKISFWWVVGYYLVLGIIILNSKSKIQNPK
jgi:competence protein ComEC